MQLFWVYARTHTSNSASNKLQISSYRSFYHQNRYYSWPYCTLTLLRSTPEKHVISTFPISSDVPFVQHLPCLKRKGCICCKTICELLCRRCSLRKSRLLVLFLSAPLRWETCTTPTHLRVEGHGRPHLFSSPRFQGGAAWKSCPHSKI